MEKHKGAFCKLIFALLLVFARARTCSFFTSEATSRHYSLRVLCLPETKTSSDVIWRHVSNNIMNTGDSKVSWSVTWSDFMFTANYVLFPFWSASDWQNLVYIPHDFRSDVALSDQFRKSREVRHFTPAIFFPSDQFPMRRVEQ